MFKRLILHRDYPLALGGLMLVAVALALIDQLTRGAP